METELTPIQRLAYEAINEILEAKRGVFEPCMAHITEIRNSINVELMEAHEGMLGVHMDRNKQPMFVVKATQ